MLQAKRVGRKPAREKKLLNAEKQKRYREKNKEILKEKEKLRKRKSREKFMKVFPLLYLQGKGETRVKKKKRKKTKNAANNNTDEEPLVVNMKFPALSMSLKRAKSSLLRTEPKNELLLKHCLRILSQ